MDWLAGIVIGAGLAAAVFAVLRRRPAAAPPAPDPDAIRGQLSVVAREVLQQVSADLAAKAQSERALDRQIGASELDARRQAVEHSVKGLEQKLKDLEGLVTRFESDRTEKYGGLERELKRLTTNADQLQRTTASLTAVLGNSRVRGQWGQKMAEDILRLCGLQEGVQFEKEQGIAGGRPDFTFRLPDGHSLYMDVKFPLDHYLRFAEAQREEEQRSAKDAFIKSVREHLREMEKRAYGAGDASVDYTILFIPNEQVYASVNEWMPQLIDECLQKKLILCGPWTLYAIVRIVHQAWQNYQFSTAVRDIVKTINGFMQDYSRFKDRFGELGGLLQKLDAKYQEIAVTSAKQLDAKIRRIEEYRKGQNIQEGLPEQQDAITFESLTRSNPSS